MPLNQKANRALHRTAIPLRSIAAGELGRSMKKNMSTKILFGTKHIDWEEAFVIFTNKPKIPKRTEEFLNSCERMKTAFENSYVVCSLYDEDKLIGFCRALSDGVRQSVIYDLNVSSSYQNNGYGSILMENIISKLPKGPTVLFSVPGKEGYYKRFGFHRLKTGLGKFPDYEKRKLMGYI